MADSWRSTSRAQYAHRWAKHAAINLGQGVHELANLLTPPAESLAARARGKAPIDVAPGTLTWCLWGLADRLPLVALDVWYAAVPPELHDGANCLELDTRSIVEWFLCACASDSQLH